MQKETALANRAFTRIRKYVLGGGRPLMQEKDLTVMATDDKAVIPPEEKEKICADLRKAAFLGAKGEMILDALKKYCH